MEPRAVKLQQSVAIGADPHMPRRITVEYFDLGVPLPIMDPVQVTVLQDQQILIRSGPDIPVGIFSQRPHRPDGRAVNALIVCVLAVFVPGEAVNGADPDPALTVLKDRSRAVAGQTVTSGDCLQLPRS